MSEEEKNKQTKNRMEYLRTVGWHQKFWYMHCWITENRKQNRAEEFEVIMAKDFPK